jgi:hypothetical protein
MPNMDIAVKKDSAVKNCRVTVKSLVYFLLTVVIGAFYCVVGLFKILDVIATLFWMILFALAALIFSALMIYIAFSLFVGIFTG